MVGDFGWEHEGTKSGVDTVKHPGACNKIINQKKSIIYL